MIINQPKYLEGTLLLAGPRIHDVPEGSVALVVNENGSAAIESPDGQVRLLSPTGAVTIASPAVADVLREAHARRLESQKLIDP